MVLEISMDWIQIEKNSLLIHSADWLAFLKLYQY